MDKIIANRWLVLGILVKYLEERTDIDKNKNETRVFRSDFFNQERFGYSSDFTETIRKLISFDKIFCEALNSLLDDSKKHLSK